MANTIDESSSPETSRHASDGFVLVVVIWLAGLIAALSVGFAIKVRLDTIAASAVKNSAATEFIADGMARLTAWRLAAAEPVSANGLAISCQWNMETIVTIAVQDQSGLVNLNLMPVSVYQDLFTGIGVPQQQAGILASELVDFRDPDSVSSTGEAEPTLYPKENFGPKNAPFQIAEEIDQLPGLRDDWYRALKPLVTTYSGQAAVDPQTAPVLLRHAFQEPATGLFQNKLAPFAGGTEGKTFDIRVMARKINGGQFERQTMVVLLRQPDRPYATLSWQRGTEAQASAPANLTLPPCIKG
jgi:general secretion pathway protein K